MTTPLIFLSYSPLFIPVLYRFIFKRISLVDPILLLSGYTFASFIHFSLNITDFLIDFNYLLIVFISNIIYILSYFYFFQKTQYKESKQISNYDLISINHKRIGILYYIPALILLFFIGFYSIKNGFSILDIRKDVGSLPFYFLINPIIVSLGPCIFIRNLLIKKQNKIFLVIPILVSLSSIMLGSTSGLIAFSISSYYYYKIYRNEFIPSFSFRSLFNIILKLLVDLKIKSSNYYRFIFFSISSLSIFLFYGYLRILRIGEYQISGLFFLKILDLISSRFDSLFNSLNLISQFGLNVCPTDVLYSKPFHLLYFFLPRSIFPDKPLPINAIFSMKSISNLPFDTDGFPTVTLDHGIYLSSICDLQWFLYPIVFIFAGGLAGYMSKKATIISSNNISFNYRIKTLFVILCLGNISYSIMLTQLSRNFAEYILQFIIICLIALITRIRLK